MGQTLSKFRKQKDIEILKRVEYKHIKKRLKSYKSIQYGSKKFSSLKFYNFVLPKNDEQLFTLVDHDHNKNECSLVRSFSNPSDLTYFRISSNSVFNVARKRSTIQSLTDIKNLRARFHDPYLISPTESEIELFGENIQMIMHRHYTLKIPQKEIKRDLGDQINWLIEECNWKMTLLEYMTLFNEDLGSILSRNYRTDDIKDLILRDSWLNNYYYFRSINENNTLFFELELDWIRILSVPRALNVNEIFVNCVIFNETKKSSALPIFKQRKLFLKHIYREQLDIFNSKKLADIIVEKKKGFRFTLMGLPSSDYEEGDEDDGGNVIHRLKCMQQFIRAVGLTFFLIQDPVAFDTGDRSSMDVLNTENMVELATLTLDIRKLMMKLDNNISQKFYFTDEFGQDIADVFLNISNIQILRTNILYALTKNDYG